MKIIQQQIISFNSACEQGTGHFLSVLSKDNFWEGKIPFRNPQWSIALRQIPKFSSFFLQ